MMGLGCGSRDLITWQLFITFVTLFTELKGPNSHSEGKHSQQLEDATCNKILDFTVSDGIWCIARKYFICGLALEQDMENTFICAKLSDVQVIQFLYVSILLFPALMLLAYFSLN